MLATNVEFWSAVVLDFAEVPAHMFTSMFTCARVAGWSAHILEQKQLEPAGPPVGHATSARRRASRSDVEGWDAIPHGATEAAPTPRRGALDAREAPAVAN